jgi:hypothetical protein
MNDALKTFVYMFPFKREDGRRAYMFFRGWLPAFVSTCTEIDALLGANKRGFHWTRCERSMARRASPIRWKARHALPTTSTGRTPCSVRIPAHLSTQSGCMVSMSGAHEHRNHGFSFLMGVQNFLGQRLSITEEVTQGARHATQLSSLAFRDALGVLNRPYLLKAEPA